MNADNRSTLVRYRRRPADAEITETKITCFVGIVFENIFTDSGNQRVVGKRNLERPENQVLIFHQHAQTKLRIQTAIPETGVVRSQHARCVNKVRSELESKHRPR